MTPADTAGPGGGALPASGHAERWMQVHELLCRFQSAFDEHDWDALAACLAPRVYTDYSSFRGTAPATVDRDEYVGLRRAALSTLRMQHGFSNLRVIDCSICPQVPSGNTNAPAIMIGERGADLLLGW